MITNHELLEKLDTILSPQNFQDYCPNGLQVEGSLAINRIITGVSLSQDLIDKAISVRANAIIVHHGIFWNKDDYKLTGIKQKRIKSLIEHSINLYAYHLPLDNHPTLGNNAQLAQLLNIKTLGSTALQNLLWFGELQNSMPLSQFIQLMEKQLQHTPLCLGHKEQHIRKIAWCTGGASSFFSEAIALGVDAFITGEAAEPSMSMAKESGVAYIAAGHYATERYGILSLSNYLAKELGIPSDFVELYNPI